MKNPLSDKLDELKKQALDITLKSGGNPFTAAGQLISDNLIFNPDKNRPFPASPYWKIHDAPVDKKFDAMREVGNNMIMALSSGPVSKTSMPERINVSKDYPKLNPFDDLETAADIIRNPAGQSIDDVQAATDTVMREAERQMTPEELVRAQGNIDQIINTTLKRTVPEEKSILEKVLKIGDKPSKPDIEPLAKDTIVYRGEGAENAGSGRTMTVSGKHFTPDIQYAQQFAETSPEQYVLKKGSKIFNFDVIRNELKNASNGNFKGNQFIKNADDVVNANNPDTWRKLLINKGYDAVSNVQPTGLKEFIVLNEKAVKIGAGIGEGGWYEDMPSALMPGEPYAWMGNENPSKAKVVITDILDDSLEPTGKFGLFDSKGLISNKQFNSIEQAKNFYTQATKGVPQSTGLDALTAEARKYKSAEEFIPKELPEKYKNLYRQATKYNNFEDFKKSLIPDQYGFLGQGAGGTAEYNLREIFNDVAAKTGKLNNGRFMIDPSTGTFIPEQTTKSMDDFAHQGDWEMYKKSLAKGTNMPNFDNFVRGTIKDGKVNIYFDPDAAIPNLTNAQRIEAIKTAAKKLMETQGLPLETPVKVGLESAINKGKYLGEYSNAKTLGELTDLYTQATKGVPQVVGGVGGTTPGEKAILDKVLKIGDRQNK